METGNIKAVDAPNISKPRPHQAGGGSCSPRWISGWSLTPVCWPERHQAVSAWLAAPSRQLAGS